MKLSSLWIFACLVHLACGADYAWTSITYDTTNGDAAPSARYALSSVIHGDDMIIFGGSVVTQTAACARVCAAVVEDSGSQ